MQILVVILRYFKPLLFFLVALMKAQIKPFYLYSALFVRFCASSSGGLSLAPLVEYLGGKGDLGGNVFLGGIAIEGIVLGRNVNTIPKRLDLGEIILHVKAACLNRRSVNTEVLAVIMSANYEAIHLIMNERSLAKIREAIAAGLRIDLNIVRE